MLADIMHVLCDPDQYLVAIQGGEIYLLPVEAAQAPVGSGRNSGLSGPRVSLKSTVPNVRAPAQGRFWPCGAAFAG
jgi:hypothetical protein